MAVIVVLTVYDRLNDLLALLGIRRRPAMHGHLNGSFGGLPGGRFDAESRGRVAAMDDDNQLIDDMEDDRW